MKTWHIIIVVLIAYAIGAIYPGPFEAVKAKL